MPQAAMRLRHKGKIPDGRGKGEGALAGGESTVIVTHPHQRVGHPSEDESEPTLVAEGCGKRFRFAQMDETLSVLSERKGRSVEVEPQIDGLLLCAAPIGEMLHGDQRLL
jgi:hypothetical protein